MLLVVLAAAAVPAGVLRALCVGNACDRSDAEPAPIPFCSLPRDLRGLIAAGYREGRSPDVLAVAAGTPVYTADGGARLPWPALGVDERVPLAIAGPGVSPGTPIPASTTLDRVAPTVAEILGFDRPFPEVRSGAPIAGVARAATEPPRLVLLVAWKGVGARTLQASRDAWPFLRTLLREGAGALDAHVGSLPLDPAAVLTTIGTGGLPFQHGIVASLVRDDAGGLVGAFGPGSPVQVIATLADDLEHADARTLVGLVGTDPADRGLVGGGWYPDQDPVDLVLGDPAAAPLAVRTHLATGYGADGETDVLGVALEGGVARLDRWTRRIVLDAREATGGSVLVVVAGTGAWETGRRAVPAGSAIADVEAAVPGARPVVAGEVAGGLFLDQEVLTAAGVTGQAVVDPLLAAETPSGETMFADAFQGFAVSFVRYC